MTSTRKMDFIKEIVRLYDEAVEPVAQDALEKIEKLSESDFSTTPETQPETHSENEKSQPETKSNTVAINEEAKKEADKILETYTFDVHEIYHRIFLRGDDDDLKISTVANFVSQKCQGIGIKIQGCRKFNEENVEAIVSLWFNRKSTKTE